MSASVEVALDTRPPELTITAERQIDPPDNWSVSVYSNKVIGFASAALVDSTGVMSMLGTERVNDHSLLILAPTVKIPSGRARLVLSVSDEVLNSTQSTVMVEIVRPRAFIVELEIEGVFNTEVTLSRSYEVILEMTSSVFEVPHLVQFTMDSSFGIDFTIEPGFAPTLEVY